MNSQELILKQKLEDCYSEIFENELIDEIIKVGHLKTIKDGELLIDIGSDLTHIPLILEGVVKIVRKEKNGEEIVLHFLERGSTCAISFANCINHKKSIFKGVVETTMEGVFLPVEHIDEWLVKYKTWRHFIIDSYHFRLLEMVDSIDGLAFMKMDERTLKFLSDKVKINNSFDLRITHQEIADDLNTSRVVITRILKQLHDENKIYSTRNKIRVLQLFD
ncbi:Crp/Fnr family transcriptional regulator [Jejuia pallidilutea]|uniref:Transcriptional regulator n=1 Tax=Jejuia pallidilutea TaxID=504487 RepID=A0A090W5S7_9FLAO|nr:Crp/Fnr family transcriptional regulator [Jejuia pallidilutea]PQV50392.1 CRP/FNR family transcriptional regulator [Jejuia pallidilutea]GAL71558.1 transcriptional regulator [Jejuia pallidilutea]GAL88449.1 transcriptional regulator [Jejuia pallidilutea]